MTFEDFYKRKEELKISYPEFADHIGYTQDAVKKWKKNNHVPKWVNIVLSYLEMTKKINDEKMVGK